MKKYELMYILKADLDETARKEVMDKLHELLTKNGAKINDVNEKDWGLRDLAYPIKDETKGYYVVVKFEAEPNATSEFDRKTKINNNVLRFLITVDQE
jgi:small subunit ribosomal protein S6